MNTICVNIKYIWDLSRKKYYCRTKTLIPSLHGFQVYEAWFKTWWNIDNDFRAASNATAVGLLSCNCNRIHCWCFGSGGSCCWFISDEKCCVGIGDEYKDWSFNLDSSSASLVYFEVCFDIASILQTKEERVWCCSYRREVVESLFSITWIAALMICVNIVGFKMQCREHT